MKCTKCGAECDSRQLFCLRCGTPLNSGRSEDEVIKEIEVPIEELVEGISLDDGDDDIDLIIGRDLSRVRTGKDNKSAGVKSVNVNDDEFVRVYQKKTNTGAEMSGTRIENVKNRDRNTADKVDRNKDNYKNNYKDNYKEENSRDDVDKQTGQGIPKKFIFIGIAVAVLVVAIIVAFVFFGNAGKYDEYYQNGMNLYDKGKIQQSVTQFHKAADIAKNNEDKIEANIMLWKSYSQLQGYENELIDVLSDLISLDSENGAYYEALIMVYQGMDNQAAIDELIASVKDAELHARLKEFDGTTPVATLSEGEYDKPISIGLTAMSGSTIYYTINGGSATTSSEVYTTSIDLKEEGSYTIKAIAVDANGKKSRQMECKFVLKFSIVNAPEVNLDSGTYNERKKVKVTADEGCKIYYTTDQTTPTADSKEYKKSFKIPEENTVYRFVAIDEKGIASEVITRVYRFERVYKYEYDDAVSGLSDALIKKGILENAFGTYEDGAVMYFKYESIEEVDEERYYIISATKESESGSTISTETYAFGCDNGSSYKAKLEDGKYTLSEIKKK